MQEQAHTMHTLTAQSVEMFPTSPHNRVTNNAKDKRVRATSLLRLSQGLLTESKASLHTNQSSAELPKVAMTTSVSPRHRKANSPVERQQYEILNEVRKQRAALRLHDIQIQRSQIIDGIRSRAHDFDDNIDPARSQKGIHRRNLTDASLSHDEPYKSLGHPVNRAQAAVKYSTRPPEEKDAVVVHEDS